MGQYKYISNKRLYEISGVARVDRQIYFNTIKFRRGAYPTDNSIMRRGSEVLINPLDIYELPIGLLHSFERGEYFDQNGNLTRYHHRSRGQGLVYQLGQTTF